MFSNYTHEQTNLRDYGMSILLTSRYISLSSVLECEFKPNVAFFITTNNQYLRDIKVLNNSMLYECSCKTEYSKALL